MRSIKTIAKQVQLRGPAKHSSCETSFSFAAMTSRWASVQSVDAVKLCAHAKKKPLGKQRTRHAYRQWVRRPACVMDCTHKYTWKGGMPVWLALHEMAMTRTRTPTILLWCTWSIPMFNPNLSLGAALQFTRRARPSPRYPRSSNQSPRGWIRLVHIVQ